MEHENLNVTLLFSTGRDFISSAIRRITRSPCSHVAIAYDDCTFGRRCVMQSWWWGFELRTLDHWNKDNVKVAEYRLPEVDLSSHLIKLSAALGSDYEYSRIAFIALKIWLKRWMGLRFTLSPDRTPWKMICSEAVTRMLQYAEVGPTKDLNPELTSPADLLNIARGNKGVFELVGEKD